MVKKPPTEPPIIGDPPTLNALRNDRDTYEAMKYLLERLREVVAFLNENIKTIKE